MEQNCFEVFGVEVSMQLDEAKLRQQLLGLQCSLHPDKENGNEDFSSLVNEAYQTLSHPVKRLAHILEINDYIPKAREVKAELLMEAMQWREQLKDVNDDINSCDELVNIMNTRMHNLVQQAQKQLMLANLDALYQTYVEMKFIDRFINEVNDKIEALDEII